MKTSTIHNHKNGISPESRKDSGIFTDIDMTSIFKFLDREHENYISHCDKKDRFAFMKARIRILKVRGEFYSAQRYGLTYLAGYEQELVRLYEKILTDKKILKSTKKHLISVVLAKILIREIEWFIIIDQQKIIEQFFTYWKDQFQKLLASYEDPRAENISVGLGDKEMQIIYDILDGK